MRSAIDGHHQAMTRHLIGRRPSDRNSLQFADLRTAIIVREIRSNRKFSRMRL